MIKQYALLSAVAGILLLTSSLLMLTTGLIRAQDTEAPPAVEATPEATPDSAVDAASSDDYCVICHASTDAVLTFDNGATASLQVNSSTIHDSVHGASAGDEALGCTDCHADYSYPHIPADKSNHRAYTVQKSLNCTACHEEQTENLATDVHYTALIAGNLRAASCVDCHGSHEIAPPAEPRTRISETCGECHTTTFTQYRDSVHGEALFEGDPNVPTCVDCHGVHGIEHPTTALFRNRSPQLCATCHANAELMAEYDINTNVFDSYLTDFHGTTVSLFEQTAPDVPTNKAVCYDCHGVHDITRADDQKSAVIRANLLGVCQQCHPGATSDFPDSWVGHFDPTPQKYPLLFAVNLFYQFLIPLVVIGFIVLVLTDIFRMIRQRFSRQGDRE